eukprot:38080-Pleurochrysis_carterae.AAC.1
MRFLVHASVDRMFRFASEGGRVLRRASLTASARAALLEALALPVETLDACVSPFLVATAHQQAAVAVAPVGPRSVAHEPRVVKGGCAWWVTLAMLAGTPPN